MYATRESILSVAFNSIFVRDSIAVMGRVTRSQTRCAAIIAAQNVPPCRLLELPAELRNRIYHMVVQYQSKVQLKSTGYERPGLLVSCKQIHCEATPMFYRQNTFSERNHDWNPATFSKHFQLLPAINGRQLSFNWAIHSTRATPNWPNLLEWLRLYHAEKTERAVTKPSKLKGNRRAIIWLQIIGAMFVTVSLSRSQPWVLLKIILEEQRYALIACDKRWAENAI